MTPHGPDVPFSHLADLAAGLRGTTKRLEKRARIAEFLRGLRRDEVAPAVRVLVGRVFAEADDRVLNVGWATLRKALAGARQTTLGAEPLTILEVARALDRIAAARGPDSTKVRRRILESLLGRAAPSEREVLLRAIFGEMRIGVSEGVMLEAIADAAHVDPGLLRTAHMFLGDLGAAAEAALHEGAEGLRARQLRLLHPVKPMLAELAETPEEILEEHGGTTAVEFKFDGARIQVHRDGDEVRVFSRRLSDVTSSLPEVVEITRSLPATRLILEGEAVATDPTGRPLPFQDLMRRFRRVHGVGEAREEIPLRLHFFDLLHLEGRTLVDTPYRERREALEGLVPPEVLAASHVVKTREAFDPLMRAALESGHEGLMAKYLESAYTVGKRGKKWFKLKPADRLDVAIVAAEWGSGRREGWLSNYWLAVRDEASGDFQMIGKTFKGLTDEEFAWMTERMRSLAVSEEPWGFHVRPEVVVEVAYNEIQRSPHYASGFALRFARIVRIREDKGPADADTYARLQALYAKQFERKGRGPEEA